MKDEDAGILVVCFLIALVIFIVAVSGCSEKATADSTMSWKQATCLEKDIDFDGLNIVYIFVFELQDGSIEDYATRQPEKYVNATKGMNYSVRVMGGDITDISV